MKIKIILAAVMAAPLVLPNPALALLVSCFPSKCLDLTSPPDNSIYNCASYTDSCFGSSKIRSCTTCNSGYTRTVRTASDPECANTTTYYDCVKDSGGDDCDGTCDNCFGSLWIASGTDGYQKRTVATCNTATCVCSKKTEYRCAAGYYGTVPPIISINGPTGCTRCPSSGGVYGTSAAGSTAITSCYIPSGTTFSDSTGSGTYTGNCFYSE